MARGLKSLTARLTASPARLFLVFLLAGLALALGLFGLRLFSPPPEIRFGGPFAGRAPGAECWNRPVILRGPGVATRLSGFEDLAFDPVSGRVLASAYDRRKGADLISGEGLFFLGDWLFAPPPVDPARMDAWRRAGTLRDASADVIAVAAPHGIAVESREDGLAIAAISRTLAGGKVVGADIRLWRADQSGVREVARYADPRLRHANDLAFVRDGADSALVITFDRGAGTDYPGGRVGTLHLAEGGSDIRPDGPAARPEPGLLLVIAPEKLDFANGIVALPGTDLLNRRGGIRVAETRGGAVRTIGMPPSRNAAPVEQPEGVAHSGRQAPPGPKTRIRVPGGPDNLTLDRHGRVIAALHPNLLRYGAYRHDWPPGRLGTLLGLRRAASRVVRIDPETGKVETLLDIPANATAPGFPGASVALVVGDHLILGGARADGLLVCRFPRGGLS